MVERQLPKLDTGVRFPSPALLGYRTLEPSRRQVGELLGLSFYDTEEFLKRNHATIPLTMEEHERGSSALSGLIEP